MNEHQDAYPELSRDLQFYPLGVEQPRHLSKAQVAHYNHYTGRPIPSSADPAAWAPDLLAIYQRALTQAENAAMPIRKIEKAAAHVTLHFLIFALTSLQRCKICNPPILTGLEVLFLVYSPKTFAVTHPFFDNFSKMSEKFKSAN